MAFDVDFFVIGAGSGGVRAARIAAGHGAKTLVAEEGRIGGTCVIRGCVPKKLYVYASRFADDFRDAAGFGWSVGEPTFDWPTLVAAKDKEIGRLSDAYRDNLARSGAKLVEQRATVVDPHRFGSPTGARSPPDISSSPAARVRRCRPASKGSSTRSPRTRSSIFPSSRAAFSWSAAAISRSSSLRCSSAWARRSRWSCAGRTSCAASTTTCATACATRWRAPASSIGSAACRPRSKRGQTARCA